MRTGYPVPATSFPLTNSPSQTPVAPCHSWKSVTFTDWPSSAFHHSSVGNRVYRIVLWGCCTGAAGALSRVPARPTPRPPAAAAPPAARPSLTKSRRVHGRGVSASLSSDNRVPSALQGSGRRKKMRGPVEGLVHTMGTGMRPGHRAFARSGQPGMLSDKPPEHEDHAERLENREEQEQCPDPTDRCTSNEHRVEQDL